jgi:2-polyprenyl-6-methoxyphenol hydroxylase-like FAD-dependent oxidoreductase
MQSSSDKAVRAEDLGEVCVASSRHGLWCTLRQSVIEKYGKAAIEYRKVLEVVRDGDRSEYGQLRLLLHTVDEQGRKGVSKSDLVIGADGVKSVVRKALFGDDRDYDPVYR